MARRLLLAEDIGDIIGSEGTGRGGLFDGAGDRLRPVLANQFGGSQR